MDLRELEILVRLSEDSINYNIEPLIASQYTHNATIDVSLSSDGNAYIPIAIEFPQPDQSSFVGLAPAENASFTYYLNSAEFTINAYDTTSIKLTPMLIGIIVGVALVSCLGLACCYHYCCNKRAYITEGLGKMTGRRRRASRPNGHPHGHVHGHPNGHHPGHQPEMRHPIHIQMDIY
jgi:hypothetical protein